MLKQLTPLDILETWIAELKSGRHKQCKDNEFDGNGRVCAWGVFLLSRGHNQETDLQVCNQTMTDFRMAVCNTTDSKLGQVVGLNDRCGYSLPQIGEYLENEVLPLMTGKEVFSA